MLFVFVMIFLLRTWAGLVAMGVLWVSALDNNLSNGALIFSENKKFLRTIQNNGSQDHQNMEKV